MAELKSAVYHRTHIIGLVVGTATTLTVSSPPPPTPPLKFLRRSLVAFDADREVPPG